MSVMNPPLNLDKKPQPVKRIANQSARNIRKLNITVKLLSREIRTREASL